MKKTKIICSIGPSSCNPDVMEQMVNVGMNVARINFSHATKEEKEGVVASVHEVRNRTGKHIAILYDTKGPEFRNGMLENDSINLVEGKTIRIVKENVLGNEERFSVNHPQALSCLKKGDTLLLENGLMKIEIISTEDDGVTGIVINGGVLGNKKSLSVPGVHLDIPFIGEQDREDIIYACEHEGDYLALSFVSCKEDVIAAREILKEYHREDMKIISKIESATGMENLDSIVEVSDGIMVARGDMGVEIPMEEVPIVQKRFIKECNRAGKMVITATQMLESMTTNPRATRAEVSDVANAVFDGTGAIMLSGESAMGKYPVQCVETMTRIATAVEASINYGRRFKRREYDLETKNYEFYLAHSICSTALQMNAKAIFAYTECGDTPKLLSSFLPCCPIYAVTSKEKTYKQLALAWDVTPILVKEDVPAKELIAKGIEVAKQAGYVASGDIVAIAGGESILPGNKDDVMNRTVGGVIRI